MKETWQGVLDKILRSEGFYDGKRGWTNDPDDSGGPTLAGVTYNEFCSFYGLPQCTDRNWDQAVIKRLRSMSDEEIKRYYKTRKWDTVFGDDLPLGVDYMVSDVATLFGIARAAEFVRGALAKPSAKRLETADLVDISAADPEHIIGSIARLRYAFCRDLALRRPKDQKFLNGWNQRTKRVTDEAMAMLIAADQKRLVELGYQLGAVDGQVGHLTRTAVASFEIANDMPATGAINPALRKALHSANARRMPISEARSEITASSLLSRGSNDIADAMKMKKSSGYVASLLTFFGIESASGIGMIDAIIGQAEKASALFARGVQMASSVPPRLVFCVLGVAAAVMIWAYAERCEQRRVEKARKAKDVSR